MLCGFVWSFARSGSDLLPVFCGFGLGGASPVLCLVPSAFRPTLRVKCKWDAGWHVPPSFFKTFCTVFSADAGILTPVKIRCISLTDNLWRFCHLVLPLCPEEHIALVALRSFRILPGPSRRDCLRGSIPETVMKTVRNRAVPLCFLTEINAFLHLIMHYLSWKSIESYTFWQCLAPNPTPRSNILHPILHPKKPVHKGSFVKGCRKCRTFSQNIFFVVVYGKCKTSDFFDANLRTFDAKPPYFCPKKSDVFVFRKKSLYRTAATGSLQPSASLICPHW